MKKVEEVTFFVINSKKRKLTERHLIAGKIENSESDFPLTSLIPVDCWKTLRA